MKKINGKNKALKAALILGAALAFAAPAATMLQPQEVKAFSFNFNSSSTSSNSETCHGITKTVTTSTVNGETEQTVEYTDANGNILDEEIGEKAFEAAKSGVENPLEYVQGTATEAENVSDVTFHFVNDTDADISGLYFTTDDCDDWGDNLMKNDFVLESGITGGLSDCYYNPNCLFKIGIDTTDGQTADFTGLSLANCENPQDITVTFTIEDGSWYVNIN